MITIHEEPELIEIKTDPRRRQDKLDRMHKDIFRLRQEMREHELYETLRCLAIVGLVCAAWYFRAI